MEYKTIIYEKEGGIATITLNRPDKLNAVGGGMGEELPQAFEEANSDDEVRVLIITGAGRGFCSGADLTELGPATTPERRWYMAAKHPISEGIRSTALQLQNFEKPVIAAINGAAAGMGFSLALACDIRIASEKAVFSQIFIKRGLVPDQGSTYFLPRMMGLAKACEMVFTGDMLNAEQAKEYGLLNQVVPHDELMPTVKELAARIAAGPPIAMKLAKRALYKGVNTDLPTAIEFEGYAQGICFGTEDAKEGMAAFLEKREPQFKGK